MKLLRGKTSNTSLVFKEETCTTNVSLKASGATGSFKLDEGFGTVIWNGTQHLEEKCTETRGGDTGWPLNMHFFLDPTDATHLIACRLLPSSIFPTALPTSCAGAEKGTAGYFTKQ